MATPATPSQATLAKPRPAAPKAQTARTRNTGTLFARENYKWMIIGAVLIVLGFILMSGGKSDADKFDPKRVYSAVRITIAPLLVLAGLAVEVYAIMKKPQPAENA